MLDTNKCMIHRAEVYQTRIDRATQELDELLKANRYSYRIDQLRNRIRNLEELKKRFK